MNMVTKFFHEMFHPHCPECAAEKLQAIDLKYEAKACLTCEALRLELAKAHDLNRQLLDSMLKKDEEEPKINTAELKPILPNRHLPFNMRKQMLMAEDRRAAQALAELNRSNQTTVRSTSSNVEDEVNKDLTNELEEALDIAESSRVAESGMRGVK